jgi:hypothetical protein
MGGTPAKPAAAQPPQQLEQQGEQEKPNLSRVKFLKRIFNMLASSACATHAILIIITIPGSISQFVIAGYSVVLAIFVFLSEITEMAFMKWFLQSHGYLYSPFWRFMFYLLIASMQMSFETIFGYVNASAMVAMAFINSYWLIRYPGLRGHSEEIKSSTDNAL